MDTETVSSEALVDALINSLNLGVNGEAQKMKLREFFRLGLLVLRQEDLCMDIDDYWGLLEGSVGKKEDADAIRHTLYLGAAEFFRLGLHERGLKGDGMESMDLEVFEKILSKSEATN